MREYSKFLAFSPEVLKQKIILILVKISEHNSGKYIF